jgi:hypothetical protein
MDLYFKYSKIYFEFIWWSYMHYDLLLENSHLQNTGLDEKQGEKPDRSRTKNPETGAISHSC